MSFIYFMAIFGLGCFCGYVNGIFRGRRQVLEKFMYYEEEEDDDEDDENIIGDKHSGQYIDLSKTPNYYDDPL
jgi:hypothetical protein